MVIYSRGAKRIDVSNVDCDFYRFLEHDPQAVNMFFGQYMMDYSWPSTGCRHWSAAFEIYIRLVGMDDRRIQFGDRQYPELCWKAVLFPAGAFLLEEFVL